MLGSELAGTLPHLLPIGKIRSFISTAKSSFQMLNLPAIKAKIIQKLQETDEEWIIRGIQKLLDIQDTEETLFWNAVALNNLAHAYSDGEPDYDTYEVKKPNVEYKA